MSHIEPSYQTGYATSKENAHFDALWEGVTFASYPSMGRFTNRIRDFSGKQGFVPATNFSSIRCVRIAGSWRYEYTAQFQNLILGPLDNAVPAKNSTILLGYMRTNNTALNSGAFGGSSGTLAEKLSLFLPWGDGVVYFDFGGNVAGTTRVDTTTHGAGNPTMGDDDWAFTTGERGMEIWQNAIRIAHAPTAKPTRTLNQASLMKWGASGSGTNDIASFRYVVTYNRQLSPKEIAVYHEHTKALLIDRLKYNLLPNATVVSEAIAHSLGISDSNSRIFIPSRAFADNLSFAQLASNAVDLAHVYFITQKDGKLQQQESNLQVRAKGDVDLDTFVLKSNAELVLEPGDNSPIQTDQNGNARGIDSNDFQRSRSSASQVASGDYSAIGGGQKNTASGTDSFIGGGNANETSGNTGVVAGGASNVITFSSGFFSTIGGGQNNSIHTSGNGITISGGRNNDAQSNNTTIGGGNTNSVSGAGATISGGESNDALAAYATVGGGKTNSVSAFYAGIPCGRECTIATNFDYSTATGYAASVNSEAQVAHSAGRHDATDGSAQVNTFVVWNTTSDGTITDLFTDGAAADMRIPENCCWSFSALVTGLKSDGTQGGGYQLSGVVKRDGAAASGLVGTIVKTVLGEDDVNWDATAVATGNNLVIQVTGVAATTINWTARVDVAQTIVEG